MNSYKSLTKFSVGYMCDVLVRKFHIISNKVPPAWLSNKIQSHLAKFATATSSKCVKNYTLKLYRYHHIPYTIWKRKLFCLRMRETPFKTKSFSCKLAALLRLEQNRETDHEGASDTFARISIGTATRIAIRELRLSANCEFRLHWVSFP